MRTPLVFGRRSRGLTLTAAALGAVAVPTVASAATPALSATPKAAPASAPAQAAQTEAPASAIAAAVAATAPAASAASAAQAATTPATYTVRPGDTLSGIAETKLGNAGRYQEIFHLNSGKVQAHGQHLQDPNLILIGWVLNLPGAQGAAAPTSSDQPTTESAPAHHTSKSTKATKTTKAQATSNAAQSQNQNQGSTSQGSYANNLDGWIKQAISVLNSNGYYVSYNAIYQTVMHESAGNPRATNGWDSNAAAGHPSIGLMQTIAPTFNAFALPGHKDIYNPVDNIIAGVRYAASRYGSLDSVVAARCGGSCWKGY